LGPELTAEWLANRLAGKATTIKAALIDQRIIAGLGNIYVCEALWRARISPLRQASSLVTGARRPKAACTRLPWAIRHVLNDAIASGGSSLRNHIRTDGSLGEFQHHFNVYRKEGDSCPRPGCGGTIRRIVQAGRSTFFCPRCQR
jgi:formamidopyrimidine-DNA glycosylase